MNESQWSKWYPLAVHSPAAGVPEMPGIYEIRTDYEFGRLRARSRVVYVGSAAKGEKPSLRRRLIDQRIGNQQKNLSRTEKQLRQAGHALEFRFAVATDGKEAERMESQRLMDYEEENWELPPGNLKLPSIGMQKRCKHFPIGDLVGERAYRQDPARTSPQEP